MKILIAPNAFKGSLTAHRAAEIIAESLSPTFEPLLCPVADGGDGTLDCLVTVTRGRLHNAFVTGPLPGMTVNARWGELGNKHAAVIEMAEAAGLRLLAERERSAAKTTTFGVGELILNALDSGFRTIYVGLGGSATNDGGAGCAQALGIRLLDRSGSVLPPGGIHLNGLQTIDVSARDRRIADSEFICLSDVQAFLTGPSGTTSVYGSQKGATAAELRTLDDGLRHYAETMQRLLGVDVASLEGAGAAGGLGAGLNAFCGATIVSGIEYFLDLVNFNNLLRQSDVVVTAEGSIDEQTLQGKGIAGVARRAKELNKPVYAFAGRVKGDAEQLCRRLGLRSILQTAPSSMNDAEAIGRADELLSLKASEFAKSLAG